MRALTTGALLLAAAFVAGQTSSWRVAGGQVHVTCPLTVGGSFDATTPTLSGSLVERPKPESFDGQIEVDLRTLDSGIALRDEHLRNTYLEVGRGAGFEKATLSEIRVDDADPRVFQGETGFTGVLSLHGTKHPVSGRARVHRQGASAQIEAAFAVKLADYGIATPQYLGVGVKEEVHVKVSFVVAPADANKDPR